MPEYSSVGIITKSEIILNKTTEQENQKDLLLMIIIRYVHIQLTDIPPIAISEAVFHYGPHI